MMKEFDPDSQRGKKPTKMRPIEERIFWQSEHFIIMEACSTPAHGWTRRGHKYALIEPVNMANLPRRIDKRLKSIKQIISVKEIYNKNHEKAYYIARSYIKELRRLGERCEQLYPCHFLLKGVDYVPGKQTALDDQHVSQT